MSDDPYLSQDDGDLDQFVHVALFSHVGITDPDDWRSVVLRLAQRYAPDLLADQKLLARQAPRKGGRPEKWNAWQLTMLDTFVEMIKERSRAGEIRTDIESDRAACRHLATSPDAEVAREILRLRPDVSPRSLENRLVYARRLRHQRRGITETR